MSVTEGHGGGAETVEFRIHGIGNQPPWHALGEPRVVTTTAAEPSAAALPDAVPAPTADSATPVGNQPDRFIESFTPPDHSGRIWLINWARTSRRTARFNWFLAIPLTMVNVAGHMRPEADRPGRRLLPVAVNIVAAWMTVAVVIWLIVLAETALKYGGAMNLWVLLVRIALTAVVVFVWRAYRGQWPLLRSLAAVVAIGVVWFHPGIADAINRFRWDPAWWSLDYLVSVILVGGVGVAGGTIGRRIWGVTKAPLGAVIVHTGIALLTTAFVVMARPVRWPAPPWLPQWATIRRPAAKTCVNATSFDPTWVCQDTMDLVTIMVVLSTATAVALAGLLLLAHLRTPSSLRGPNLAGAALLLVLATVVLHAVASISRVAINWLLDYLDQQRGSFLGGSHWPTPIAFRWLTPTDNSDQFVYRPDLAVLPAAAFLLALGLVGYAVIRLQWGLPTAPQGASTPHRVVQSLPSTLAPIVGVGLILFVAATVGLGVATSDSHTLPGWVRVLIGAIVQGSALLLALLYAGRLARARDVLSRFADVAGFWPVLYHPLAGSSYRGHVLRGIVHEVARADAQRVVMVGHSQGSVLAACVVGGRFEAAERPNWPDEVRLLTCGCPLASLYRAFFPTEFTADFFRDVRDGADGHWVNCWRATDGIASELPDCQNVLLPDPRPVVTLAGEKPPEPRGHGDYWTDEGQVLHVQELADAASVSTTADGAAR